MTYSERAVENVTWKKPKEISGFNRDSFTIHVSTNAEAKKGNSTEHAMQSINSHQFQFITGLDLC